MKLEFKAEVIIPTHAGDDLPRYIRRGHDGNFNFDIPGHVLFDMDERLKVFHEKNNRFVGTACVMTLWLERDKEGKKYTTITLDKFEFTKAFLDHLAAM